ncbi:poly(A) polymerase [Bordetella trematum]|uniref:Poly(A) polymerase I n=1 Tax=Bordetella trematum TaxID=123899 RepID=A0A157S8Q7_9BORD|nr:polynucleotide adenylyltransferase PcnB [Bordetella trematum]AUL48253.1 poly(A) polymerase [Bordetella trematum]AZR95216.1 poly(A) polymerase [Bordetella trematum]NNH18247.1 polynucleotide adenylyltransferase PcnB [Bordetella trematum]QIM70160.1 polynucleotide adenylyltransferase PcnB [Bordetella trematum]SAI50036.1 poly(A) polymerase [Bordetella trematum]
MITDTIRKFVGRLFGPALSRGPQRIPSERHGIDRRNVSRHAIKVCEVLRQHGYEAYVVGGAVRDLILGLEPKDFDVATNATPEQIRPLFRRARIIGRRFQLVHVVFGQEIIETSTFRAPASADQETDEHGRILRDNVFGSQEEDAARRDFTMNALYYDPHTEEVIDYHNGVQDLKKRQIRMIGDPVKRYREDPVRMLRAVRFAAKLNGTLDPATRQPISTMAGLIENVPASRLFDEMLKLLTCGHAMDCLRQLRADGLHHGLLPLLDVVLEQPGGEHFVELALERTDARVRAGKTISPSFLFAALLWQQVESRWKELRAQGEHSMPALLQAADSVLDEQTEKLAIQRRFSSDMREIWFMQPRFERRAGKTIYRMIEQPRFRAACDFLQLRAAAGEFDSVLAQWWMDLANGNDETRAEMIEELAHLPREEHRDDTAAGSGAAASTRRRRRRRSRSSQRPE